jgi:hypothetical protein
MNKTKNTEHWVRNSVGGIAMVSATLFLSFFIPFITPIVSIAFVIVGCRLYLSDKGDKVDRAKRTVALGLIIGGATALCFWFCYYLAAINCGQRLCGSY